MYRGARANVLWKSHIVQGAVRVQLNSIFGRISSETRNLSISNLEVQHMDSPERVDILSTDNEESQTTAEYLATQ